MNQDSVAPELPSCSLEVTRSQDWPVLSSAIVSLFSDIQIFILSLEEEGRPSYAANL